MVKLKINNKWIEYPSEKKTIFVIRPGAGTFHNKDAYNQLEKYFHIIYFGKTGGQYDNYPDNWPVNSQVSSNGNHLGGICEIIKNYIIQQNIIPSLILVGSRGGQVSIGKIWENIWRGPTVIINAGCLLTHTHIPKEVKPLFITMGKDYFEHVNTIEKVKTLYDSLSDKQQAYIIHLPYEAHMPQLVEQLEKLL